MLLFYCSLNPLNVLLYSCSHELCREIICNSYLCSSVGKVCFFHWLLSRLFFFIFDFWFFLKMVCLDVVFWGTYLAWCFLTFLICGLLSDITLGKFSVIIISSTSVPFFLAFLEFSFCVCYMFCRFPSVLGYSLWLHWSLFSLLISFGGVYCYILNLKRFPPQPYSVY